jgi:hypothetical protein
LILTGGNLTFKLYPQEDSQHLIADQQISKLATIPYPINYPASQEKSN